MAVFVDETAEAVDPFDLPDAARRRWAVCRQWGLQVEASVWPGGVVVLDVDGEDVFEVAAVGLCCIERCRVILTARSSVDQ